MDDPESTHASFHLGRRGPFTRHGAGTAFYDRSSSSTGFSMSLGELAWWAQTCGYGLDPQLNRQRRIRRSDPDKTHLNSLTSEPGTSAGSLPLAGELHKKIANLGIYQRPW